MSDLRLSLPHCHRYAANYVAQLIYTILNHICPLRDLHFTLMYVVVSQQFDKRFHLKSYLNAHNKTTCIQMPKNILYCAKDDILHY